MSLFIKFTFCILVFVNFQSSVYAKSPKYYCDFGTCEVYCCGYNRCCDKLLDLWYFWLGLGIVIVVVVGILFLRYYLGKKKRPYKNYNLLENT